TNFRVQLSGIAMIWNSSPFKTKYMSALSGCSETSAPLRCSTSITTARVTVPSLMNSGSLGNEVINSVEREYFLKNMGGHLRIEPLLAVRIAQEFLPHLRRSDLQKSLYRAINLQVGFVISF